MNQNHLILLFDGDCNFCSFWVKFVIERDKKDRFRFASLQSIKGKELLEKHHLEPDLSTVVLIKDDCAKTKSSAALYVTKELKGIYQFAFVFMMIPKLIRDWFYDLIAANRKKIMKGESCIIPTESIKNKFLE
ncbi:MAG: DUF393 domain-containing protein [Flavobacteriales bacterium]|nr:DUF393 domain-containing protein [Flavobacteriales bacterium]